MSASLFLIPLSSASTRADEPASQLASQPGSPPLSEPASQPAPAPLEDDPPAEEITISQRPPAEAASSVHFDAHDLALRPHASTSDLVRQVPCLVVAQHAGGGKADQLFLRGFDADHGTDVAVFADGVPVNLTSHGHGQGYADMHFLIPETVTAIDVHKGPYAARFGDFYTAGAVELRTLDSVDGARVSLGVSSPLDGPRLGEQPGYRLVGLASPQLSTGSALVAGELGYSDGPFANAQKFRRGNGLLKWSGPAAGGRLSLEATAYAARWNQSGQVPAAEVDAGRLDRFGSLDPSEGGTTSRTSLQLGWDARDGHGGRVLLAAYHIGYRLRLFSDFTLYARDPENGDEIEQTDARTVDGVSGTYSRTHRRRRVWGTWSAGLSLRADDTRAQLWHDAERVRLADCFAIGGNPCNDTVDRIRDLALWLEDDAFIGDHVEVIAGARTDVFVWDVDDLDPETATTPSTTGGSAQKVVTNPKLSVIWRPTHELDVFANAGGGFHSNDARAAVSSRGRGALAQAWGAEIGARVRPRPGLELAAAAWYLHLSSEQVWNGDEGGTEPSGATQRLGLDVDGRWQIDEWVVVDANVALARSTLVANQGNGGALALAPRIMGGAGAAFVRGPLSISLRARGIGARPANDDGSLTAQGYLIFDLVGAWVTPRWWADVTLVNLLDSSWRDAQFAETSRVSPTTPLVEDVHFTPGAPLTLFATLGAAF